MNTRICGIGAIIGDMVGSPYEFDMNNIKSEDFPFFSDASHFTDDTVMTLAVAVALSETLDMGREVVKKTLVEKMTLFGKKYPYAGYGAMFKRWICDPAPYGSYGNGAAMRVSPAGWLYDTLEKTLAYAEMTAEVSHNHPEGVKGAKATAAAIFLSRNGMSKQELKKYVENNFGYNLKRTLAEIRPGYRHVESCQETVPEAIIAFMEGESFEDVTRKAVSLGGDSDTLAAIAASIAEACYPVPDWIIGEALSRLDPFFANSIAIYQDAIVRTGNIRS